MLWSSLLIYTEELMFLSKLELLISRAVRGLSFAKATEVLRKKTPKLFVDLFFSDRLYGSDWKTLLAFLGSWKEFTQPYFKLSSITTLMKTELSWFTPPADLTLKVIYVNQYLGELLFFRQYSAILRFVLGKFAVLELCKRFMKHGLLMWEEKVLFFETEKVTRGEEM